MSATKSTKKSSKQRVRVTKKLLESRQFSTVRLPNNSRGFEIVKANVHALSNESDHGVSAERSVTSGPGSADGTSGAPWMDEHRATSRSHASRYSVGGVDFSSLPSNKDQRGEVSVLRKFSGHSSRDGDCVVHPVSKSDVSPAFAFDPIPNDPMFEPVLQSSYWPPPKLSALESSTGISVVGTDGFDSYDRRADDKLASRSSSNIVKGELNHPRGKERRNTIIKLDSDESEQDA